MDWHLITSDIAAAEELAGEARELYLERLSGSDPDRAAQVRRHLLRTERLAGFMRTSSGASPDPVSSGLAPQELVGVWRIEKALGSGGMGAVYRVQRDDGQFEQSAALKVMLAASDPAARERFRRERERLASLEHHGISRIIDGGETHQGRPYMVVELIEGQTIDDHVRARRISRRRVVELLIELTKALSHAHARLVLHRDVKASNVLVDEKGSVRLIDFGVSALLDTEAERVGPLTIAYAAPELLGSTSPSAAADIFSTGMLAHELLAGALPARRFDGSGEVAASLVRDRDLVAILSQATAGRPEDRYPSTDALAADLEAWLLKRPVAARRGGAGYVAVKFLQRHPVGSCLAVLAMLSLGGGLVGTTLMARRAQAEADRANAALARADRNARFQNTYVDVLLRLFGGKGNTERLTGLLMERAEQARLHEEEDPERAAEINLSIARTFVERNDFRSAAEVLEPWVSSPYGSPRIIVDGHLYLGLSYRYLGEFDRAVPFLEKAIAHYERGAERASYEHILASRMLASCVTNPTRIYQELDALIPAALQRDRPVEQEIFLYDTWGSIFYAQGDFKRAYVHSKKVLELLDEHPLAEVSRRDNIRLTKSIYDVFLTGDFAAARRVLDDVERNLERSKGTSLNTIFLYEYRGYMLSEEGEFESALEAHRRAVDIAREFSELGSVMHLHAASFLMETLMDAGRLSEARALHDELDPIVEDRHGGRHQMYVLAKSRLLLETEGPKAASAVMAKVGMSRDLASTGLILTTRLDRLIERGVEPAPDKPSS